MAASRTKMLHLYKSLLRESQKFSSYNFRNYALRRVRDAFKENKNITDTLKARADYEYGLQQLEVIKRQVLVGNLYQTEKLVIEKKTT